MRQSELDRAVARRTGESLRTIRCRGFSEHRAEANGNAERGVGIALAARKPRARRHQGGP